MVPQEAELVEHMVMMVALAPAVVLLMEAAAVVVPALKLLMDQVVLVVQEVLVFKFQQYSETHYLLLDLDQHHYQVVDWELQDPLDSSISLVVAEVQLITPTQILVQVVQVVVLLVVITLQHQNLV